MDEQTEKDILIVEEKTFNEAAAKLAKLLFDLPVEIVSTPSAETDI